MHDLNEEKTIDQQTTIPIASLPAVTTVPAPPPAVATVPDWPPPPRPRPAQGLSRPMRILLVALAVALIFSGLGLLIYSTTSQYDRKLGALDGRDATAAARALRTAQAIHNTQSTATAGPLQTADARIYATATASAGPAATASATGAQGTATTQAQLAVLTKITSGAATLNDPLSDNTQSHAWDVGYADNNNTGCNFVDGSYKVQEALPTLLRPCFADATNFQNFAYQASMTMNTACAGGLLFRGNKSTNAYYLFTVNADGTYLFEFYGSKDSSHAILSSGSSPAILGVGQTNTLAVIANKGVMDLFVNQAFLAEIADVHVLSGGQIGVAVYNTRLPASASFSDAEVWKI
ncbi:MAG TPA: hypothetical protein VF458_10390 [Ktedonobacteraceae bacterium]